MSASVTVLVDGSDIDVEFSSPTLSFELISPVLGLDIDSATELLLSVGGPTLDVAVGTTQLIFPVTGTGTTPPRPLVITWGETPIGTIDGVNKIYTSALPYSPNQIAVFLNGLRQRRIQDYNETGSQSFSFLSAPLPGDSISIDYIQP